MLKGYYDKVTRKEAQIKELHPVMDTSVERFKLSEEYRTLLKGDTATLLCNFCQKVSEDYPGISSHFTIFVIAPGKDYVVSLFEDLPEEDPPYSEDAFGSDSSEDVDGDES
ncbi:hypothetical protein LIER_39547 [Lithospermum erythrorhizon]|uniref:Uncharacterized protein n=1 Tax=Lithospermum erythrorhizon TaxID=34254 RepID=A0AAV3QJH5_LITER